MGGQALAQAIEANRIHRLDRGHLHGFDTAARNLADQLEHALLAWLDEQNRRTLAPCPARAPDAVHIHLGVARHVVVKDVADALDIQSACGDIGGHDNMNARILEPLHRLLALLLAEVTAKRLGRNTAPTQKIGHFGRRGLGAHEHHGRIHGFGFEQTRQQLGLLAGVHQHVALGNGGGRGGGLLDAHLGRVDQMLGRNAGNRPRHGGRKQGDLTVIRGMRQHPFHVVDEAHPQHLVRFVQHQHLQVRDIQRALAHMVHHPSGRADHNIHTRAQGAGLRRVRRAAVDRNHAAAGQPLGVGRERLGHLLSQLTGGRQHQGGGRAPTGLVLLRQHGQQGQRKCRRLAGAGLGHAQHIPAIQQIRDGLGLDRRGFFVPEGGYGLENGVGKTKRGKA